MVFTKKSKLTFINMKHLTLFWQQLVTISANTTCRQLVNRFVTTCLQTCNNLCVFTCKFEGIIFVPYSHNLWTTCVRNQGRNLGITAGGGGGGGGVSLFCPTKRAWRKSYPMDILGVINISYFLFPKLLARYNYFFKTAAVVIANYIFPKSSQVVDYFSNNESLFATF
jgi:hypothetical protein